MFTREVLPFHRVIPIGNEFQGFQSPQGDGLFHRLSGVNRLFYAREFDKAEEVLTTLVFEGVEAMREKAVHGSGLHAVWEEMSGLGFFYDFDGMTPYSIAWLIDHRTGIFDQMQAYQKAFAGFDYHSPLLHAFVPNADAVAIVGGEIEQCAMNVILPPPPKGETERVGPRIHMFSPLLGDESAASPLIDYLERTETRLIFETSATEEAVDNPVLRRLEAEGFLPGFRIALGTDLMLDSRRQRSTVQMIARCLEEQSNREVNLRFERPRAFGSPDQLHRYFDGLEFFLDLVLDLEVDLSRLSVVQRPSLCLLESRNVDHFLEARLIDGAFHFHHYFDGDFLITVQPSRENLEEFRCALLDLTQSGSEAGGSRDAAYHRFIPKNLPAAFSKETEAEAQEQMLVDQRRRRIWNKLFGWLLNELLHISRENVEFGRPLRLDITKDRQAHYSPLYQRT